MCGLLIGECISCNKHCQSARNFKEPGRGNTPENFSVAHYFYSFWTFSNKSIRCVEPVFHLNEETPGFLLVYVVGFSSVHKKSLNFNSGETMNVVPSKLALKSFHSFYLSTIQLIFYQKDWQISLTKTRPSVICCQGRGWAGVFVDLIRSGQTKPIFKSH